MKFTKPPLPPEETIKIIQKRGMIVKNLEAAIEFIRTVGYYRFSGYALHFEEFEKRQRTHCFKEGSNFENVIAIYEFDDKLRALLFDYIGHIEIAFRAALCTEIAVATNNSHWHTNKPLFKNIDHWNRFIDDCEHEFQSSTEIFITAYKDKYNNPQFPPVWIILEIMSMGVAAKLYANLKQKNLKKKVAFQLKVPVNYLESWIHSLSVLRNLCAHHYRVWNRNFSIRGALTNAQSKFFNEHGIDSNNANRKLVIFLWIMRDILTAINRFEDFKNDLLNLFKQFPNVPYDKMGLSEQILEELGYE